MYIYVLNNIHSYATRSNEILAKKGHYQCLYKRQKKMFYPCQMKCSLNMNAIIVVEPYVTHLRIFMRIGPGH